MFGKVLKINHKVLVIGSIYDRLDKLEKILELCKIYKLIILNGNLCYPFTNIVDIENRIKYITNILPSHKVIYNIGNYDLLSSIQCPTSTILSNWITVNPNVVILEFYNQTTTIITNGGITPHMTKNDLISGVETTFVSNIEGQPWHNKYYGQYGYIISNNPLSLFKPKFYPFSLQMGSLYCQNMIYGQEVDMTGLKNTILL